jgi:predicted ATP-dependent endonuclease of OLD family
LDKKTLTKLNVTDVAVHCGSTVVDYKNGGFGYANEKVVAHTFINTFDVPLLNKKNLKQDESPLMFELRQLILQTGTNSFNDYRLRATASPEKAIEINDRIKSLFEVIDKLFDNTGKFIQIDSLNNIVFSTKDTHETIRLEQLSSGEKQLLIILFKVFLMDNEPHVLLMDEPEMSMHVAWQSQLISVIRELNPHCQLIMTTHSPSIFGQGWGDKVTFMEHLFVKEL